ncbi:MAG: class I SAM-dependent methyltransferase [Planctomycetes bacterium]|nr:class I SAM-dependent methyltransferase [Planctomycetota bacterium]
MTPAPSRACLNCRAPLGRRILSKGELHLASCTHCKLVQTEDVWPLERYAEWYAGIDSFSTETLGDVERFLARDRRELERLAGQGGGGPMLDVGAGAGTATRAGLDRGWSVDAVELSHEAAIRLEVMGATVLREPVENLRLRAGHYGLVFMSHVLEHLRDPRGTLQTLQRCLMPGGLLQIAVPNWESLKRPLAGRGLGWIGVEHVSYFSPATLTSLVEDLGFEVVERRVLPYECERDLDFAAALAERLRLDGVLARFMALEGGGLRDFIAARARPTAAPWRSRLVVGMTHFGLALWPDRLCGVIGRADEVRLTVRRATEV